VIVPTAQGCGHATKSARSRRRARNGRMTVVAYIHPGRLTSQRARLKDWTDSVKAEVEVVQRYGLLIQGLQ
jgi:hypothetical protein